MNLRDTPQLHRAPLRAALPLAILFTAAVAAISIMPQFVPVKPAYSDSYWFGYSNRTGVAIFLLYLLLVGALARRWNVVFSAPAKNTRLPKGLVAGWMFVFAAGCGLMFLLVHGFDGFAESRYFIERIQRIAEGQKPYKDFEFAYGALLLYGPRLLMSIGLTAEQSYYIFLTLADMCGVWMLSRSLEMLDYPTQQLRSIFNLICLFALPAVISTGVNYSLFRFIPPAFLALILHRIWTRGSHQQLLAVLLTVPFTAVLLTISPEIAVAFAAGSMAYFGLFLSWNATTAAVYGGAAVLQVLTLWIADRLLVFWTLKEFSYGAYTFPIVPGPYILLYFLACTMVALFVGTRLGGRTRGDGLLLVVAVSAGDIVAALGRCDAGHVVFASLGITVAALVLTSTFPAVFRVYRVAFVLAFIFVPFASGLWLYRGLLSNAIFVRLQPVGSANRMEPFVERGMEKVLGHGKAQRVLAKLKAAGMSAANVDPTQGGRTPTLQAPFGYSPNGLGSYYSPRIETGYFFGLENAFTPATVQRKIDEIRNRPNRPLLLPANYQDFCTVNFAGERKMIDYMFLFPYRRGIQHTEIVWQPLCRYISDHYKPVKRATSDYVIMQPR